MPQLNRLHQARWSVAQALFRRLVVAAYAAGPDTKLFWQGSIIDPSQIMICDDGIYVLSLDLRCKHIMFEPKVGLDHGLYTKAAEFAKHIREDFKIAKIQRW